MGINRLAITGGIGSGKSFVCDIFIKMGIPVYFSDARTKALYDTDRNLLDALASLLGSEIIRDGRLDKSRMAKLIFADAQLLKGVEEIVHPAVVEDFEQWCGREEELYSGDVPPFLLMESAIILEKPLVLKHVDRVITVSAPLEERLRRVMLRDGVSSEEAYRRIDVQWEDSKREALSAYTIINDNVTPLLPQLEEIIAAERSITDR